MEKKVLDIIKQKVKQEKGLKRVKIEPYILKGTNMKSEAFVLINGKKQEIYKNNNIIEIL